MDRSNMKRCLEFFSEDSKIVLCLLYACKGIGVPQDALGLMFAAAANHKHFDRSIHNVSKICGRYLRRESRCLPSCFLWTEWYLSASLRDYLVNNMAGEDDIRSILETLLGGAKRSGEHNPESQTEDSIESEKARAVTALRALYFDHTHTDKVVRDAAIRATANSIVYSNSNHSIYNATQTLMPMFRIMYESLNDGSRLIELQSRCARKIFLKYVHERQIDDASISTLLNFNDGTFGPLEALVTINRLYSETTEPLLDEHNLCFLENLVDRLKSYDGKIYINTDEASQRALRSICGFFGTAQNEDLTAIAAILGAIGSLIKHSITSIRERSPSRLALIAISSLCELSKAGESTKLRILKEDGVIEVLAVALSHRDDPNLQEIAATTLSNLSDGIGHKVLQILNEYDGISGSFLSEVGETHSQEKGTPTSNSENLPNDVGEFIRPDGILPSLVRFLSTKKSHRRTAIRVLTNLTSEIRKGNARENLNFAFLKQSTALADLADAMSDEKCNLAVSQTAAAEALLNLSFGPDWLPLKIVDDGALPALVKSLLKDDNRCLQKYAAATLHNLASRGERLRTEILKQPLALPNLVRSLCKDDHPVLQENAAGAVLNLACSQDSSKLDIVEAGALAALVRSLLKDQTPRLQENAALALSNLAYGRERVQMEILKEPMALPNLVRSLSKENSPILQVNAAEAVCNLACGQKSSKIAIVKAGALAALVKALLKDDNPRLQGNAAHTLMNISYEPRLKIEILKEPMALPNLVRLLSAFGNLNLKETGEGTLSGSAFGEDSTRVHVMPEEDTPATVLSNDGYHRSQESADGAVRRLEGGTRTMKDEFLKEGALDGIVPSLAKDNRAHLQIYGAATLANLSSGGESIKMQILNQDGALAGLVTCLLEDLSQPSGEDTEMRGRGGAGARSRPSSRKCATEALKLLSRVQDCSMKQKIKNQDGLLAALADLANCDSEQDNSALQRDAKEALNNLKDIP